jgi:hypothetical protein
MSIDTNSATVLLRCMLHWRHCSYAQARVEFASVGKIAVKGKAEKLEVFIPIKEKPQASHLMHAIQCAVYMKPFAHTEKCFDVYAYSTCCCSTILCTHIRVYAYVRSSAQ